MINEYFLSTDITLIVIIVGMFVILFDAAFTAVTIKIVYELAYN